MKVKELLEILKKAPMDVQVFAGYGGDELRISNSVCGAIYVKDLCETDDSDAEFTEGIYLRM